MSCINTKLELKELICSDKNRSGYYSKENCWKKYFVNFYNELLMWSFPDNFKFQQKVYHYLNDDPELKLGICPECGKRCRFFSSSVGYSKFCSLKCRSNSSQVREQTKISCLEKYGSEFPLQSNNIKEKTKQTCLEKYGCENPAQAKEVQEKMKQTCLERYGVDNAFKSEEKKEKIRQTCLEKYGSEHYTKTEDYKEKSKQTCLEKYGKERFSQSIEFKEKYKETCLEKYGCDSYPQSEEFKEKYKDAEYVENIVEKIKQSNRNNFNSDWYFQSDEYKNKYKDVEWVQSKLDKTKETNLEHFGTDWYFQSEEFKKKFENYIWVKSTQEKILKTKKKNNSFNTSKIEQQLKQYLDENNISYIYQYTSEQYPFNCDFYFPEKDFYVEIQGSWTHGHHPYTNSEEDILLLEKWKSKNTDYYNNAIETWTVRDVKKRETAKQNNLNYVEIFSCDLQTCINKINEFLEYTYI